MKLWFSAILLYSMVPSLQTLECFLERTATSEMPYWRQFCDRPIDWMQNSRAENCIKIVHGGHVERSCDSDFYCNRFHVRNRCIKGLLGDGSEICCCSTDRCNASNTHQIFITQFLSLFICATILKHII